MPQLPAPTLVTKIRILREGIYAFGPGKAALLEAIERSGSVVGAGRALGLSYSKTRRLVDEMNDSFLSPLVEAAKGGHAGGGATVTSAGREVLALFRRMEQHANAAVAKDFQTLQSLLNEPPTG